MSATRGDAGRHVILLGVGARTPVGLDAPASASAVRAAICATAEHRYFVDAAGEKMSVASDADLPMEVRGLDRLVALAATAMSEALRPLSNGPWPASLPVFVGMAEPRPGRDERVEQELARALDGINGAAGLKTITSVFPYGHAAGLMALEAGWKAVRSGQTDVCLVGGVDSYLEPETLEWLDTNGQLMSARNRSGFPPGEAAGFCLLGSSDSAERMGLPHLGRIAAAVTTVEEKVLKSKQICIGEGLSSAFAAVTAGLKLPEQKISTIYCDLNGERYRVEEYAFAALRSYAAFVSVHNTVHPADCWGDVGASSGPLYACLAAASAQRSYSKGPRALLFAGSECGYRSTALLELPINRARD